MANVDQRKYLKRYLDDDQVKRRKKRVGEHSSSYPERVRIIDDDGNYSRSRKYDDDNDFILTGEDAPQIVGVVDDRPPELKAVEDFRNSSKWKSLDDATERLTRGANRSEGSSQRYNDRRRSRSPIKRDYSPQRRMDRKDPAPAYDSRKRRSVDDYSPIRRKRDEDPKPREAHYPKREKSTSYSEDINARRREVYGRPAPKGNGFGHYRDSETNNRDTHDYSRATSFSRPHPAAYAQKNQHDGRRQEHTVENGRSNDYLQREGHHRIEYNRYSRNDATKPNPFRATSPPARSVQMSQRNDYSRRRSPAKPGNPFRSGRPASLSPLPDKRGDAAAGDGRHFVRMQKYSDTRPRFESHSAKPSFTRSSTPPQYNSYARKSSNPFREQVRGAMSRGSGFPHARPDSAQVSHRPPMDRNKTQRPGGYYSGLERKQESASHDFRPYRKSRSPIKSGVQIANSHSRIEKRYQEIKSDHSAVSHDRDLSPVRRRKTDEDLSPVRRRKSAPVEHSSRSKDEKKNEDREDDLSPVRRRKHSDSPSDRNKGQTRIKKSRFSSPDDSGKSKRTLDGKRAGLQNAGMLKKENEDLRRREDEHFNKLSSHVSGRNADVVVRDKRSGRVRDLEEKREKDEEKRQRDKERQEIYDKWGKGLKQVEDYRNKVASDQHESNKPLARYSNDEDLDKMLRDQERIGDPMLEYMRQKTTKSTANAPKVPVYNGPYPDNRFNIRPGYRWDGVDRSNGYEKKWLNVQNQKVAIREEAYRYSTEDM